MDIDTMRRSMEKKKGENEFQISNYKIQITNDLRGCWMLDT